MSRAATVGIVVMLLVMGAPGAGFAARVQRHPTARKPARARQRAAGKAPVARKPLQVYTMLDALGNGRTHYTRQVPSGGSRGTMDLIASLAQGLAVADAHLTLPSRASGLTARAFARATVSRIVGEGEFHTPPLGEGTRVDADLRLHQDADTSRLGGHWNFDVPVDLTVAFPVKSFALSGGAHGTWQAGTSQLHMGLRGGIIQKYVAVDAVKLDWSDRGELTALSVTVSAPTGSWLAAHVAPFARDPSATANTVRQHLDALQIHVKAVKIAALSTARGEEGITFHLEVEGLRKALAGMLDPIMAQFASKSPALPAAVHDMLQLEVSDWSLEVTRKDDDLELDTAAQVQHFDRFMIGYLELLAGFSRMMGNVAPLSQKPLERLAARATQAQLGQLLPVFRAVYSSPGHLDMDYAMHLDNGNGHVKSDGQLGLTMDIRGVMAALKSQDYPAVERQDAGLTLSSDGTRLDGRAWLDEAGPWLEAVRRPYASAAREDPALHVLLPLVADAKLKDARWSLVIDDGRLDSHGFVQTTPLGVALNPLLKASAPGLDLDMAGAELHWIHRGGPRATLNADLYWSRLEPTGIAALNAMLGSWLGRAIRNTVRSGAATADLMLPHLTAPTVERPAGLQDVLPPEPAPKSVPHGPGANSSPFTASSRCCSR